MKKDVRREISTTANRYDGLDINITSSETDVNIDAYVKIGKTLVNSANYDAKFTLNDVREALFCDLYGGCLAVNCDQKIDVQILGN